MDAPNGKLLVLGFDGLDYEILNRRLRAEFDLLPLHAPIPVTGPSWTSLYTGDSMSTHGVQDVYGLEFRRRYARNDTLHLVRWHLHNLGRLTRGKETHKRYKTCATTPSTYVWDTLGEAGVCVKLVAMPITCPVRPVNGVHVGGFPVVKRNRWYYPDEIGEQIPEEYPQLVDIPHWFQDPERDSHRHWRKCLTGMGLAAAEQRIAEGCDRLADFFLSLPDADLQMIQFSFVDRLGHVFGIDGEVEQFCYELVWRLVDRLREGASPDATMIVSDHGFQGPEHTDYGCLALGGTLKQKVNVPADYTPSVMDVAPTIAGFFGQTHDAEGNDLIGGGELSRRDASRDEAEKAEITERLKNLGYM